jgi:hypothetical protein
MPTQTIGKRSPSQSCSSPCRPIKYKVYVYHCKDLEVKHWNMTIFAGNYHDASLTRASPQKRGRSQSRSPSRPSKYPRTEYLAVGRRWWSSIYTCIERVNPSGASKRSRHRSQSSPHRPAKYLIVEKSCVNVDRASRIPTPNNSDGGNSKRSRSQSCSSPCRPLKHRIVECHNDGREHQNISTDTRNIVDARSTRKSTQKRSRSQSRSPGRPFKRSRTESSAVARRWRSLFSKSLVDPTSGASKRSGFRSKSRSPHRPTKYMIVDVPRDARLVGRTSRTSNKTVSDGVNSVCASTRKRCRSPSRSDDGHPVKCFILDVDHDDIKEIKDCENCTDHENPSAAVEYEEFFVLFNGDEEDCRLDTPSCFCILVYVYVMVHSSELIEFSVTQVFFFDT